MCISASHSQEASYYAAGSADNLGEAQESVSTLVQNRFEVGEELVLTMSVDRFNLGEVFAVVDEAGLLFDFVAYLEFVEFPIDQIEGTRVYRGWYIKEENSFELDITDLGRPTISLQGASYNVSPQDVKYMDDVLYVNQSLFKRWFDIEHDYKFSALRVRLIPGTPLPVQSRRARAERLVRTSTTPKAIYPELKRSYGLLSPQVLDVQLNSAYRDITNDVATNYSILGARDIAFWHTNFFLSGSDQDWLSNSRLIMSKEDIDKNLFGLGLSTVEFGDIQPVRQGLTRQRSRGVLISNGNIDTEFDLQETNLTGLLQTGWDAELYRNGILIDSQTNVQSGEYSFLDVPLNFGLNEFEIVKYGPQGQVEREQIDRLLDRSSVENSQLTYSASLTESGKSVLGTEKIRDAIDTGYNLATDFRLYALDTNWGLGLQSDFGGDAGLTTLNLSANKPLTERLLSSAFITGNSREAYAGNLSLRGLYNSQQLGLSLGYSESKSLVDGAKQENTFLSLTVQGSMFASRRYKGDYQNTVQLESAGDRSFVSIQNRLGFTTPFGRIFNNIEYEDDERPIVATEKFRGSLVYQKSLGRVFTRIGLNYNLLDGAELNTVNASANWSLNNDFKTRFSGSYNLINDDYNLDSNLSWRTGDFNLSANIGYSSVIGWLAGVNASFTLSGQPLIYGDVFQTNRSLASASSLSVRVFVDKNQNYQYDMGELLVPGVKVMTKQSVGRAETDILGIAILEGMTHNKLSDVTINIDSLPDPMLAPVLEGVSIRFRKGVADFLDFPVALTTEIEGTVTLMSDSGVLAPATKVPLNLYNEANKLVAQVLTEFDGYYVIGKVFSGQHRLELDPEFAKANRLTQPAPIIIDAKPYTGDYIFQDITLERQRSIDGFVATIAAFESRKTLNLFVALNKEKLKPLISSIAIKETQDEIQLVSKFYERKTVIDKFCQKAREQQLNCEISSYKHWF